MISLIFSKSGIMVIASVIILSIGAYIMNIWNEKTITIEQQKTQIVQYKADLGKLKKVVNSLKQTAKAQSDISRDYNGRVSALQQANGEMSDELLKIQAKLEVRNMEKLKRSAHAELVLRIINKSIIKQTMEWNSYDAAK